MKRRIFAPNKNHHRVKGRANWVVYTVYDNRTDQPVIVDGIACEAAAAMGIQMASFYSTVGRVRSGINRRWTIISTYMDELEGEGYEEC